MNMSRQNIKPNILTLKNKIEFVGQLLEKNQFNEAINLSIL